MYNLQHPELSCYLNEKADFYEFDEVIALPFWSGGIMTYFWRNIYDSRCTEFYCCSFR